mgnify:FL=1
MNRYYADLHIHTVLSPCGDLNMSPRKILEQASKKGLDIIGITDHNSTLQSRIIAQIAQEYGIYVLKGAEITSVEEVHCLCFLPDEQLDNFQDYVDTHLLKIPNKPDKLGYQVLVDEHEQIIRQIDHSLLSSLDQGVDQIREKVKSLHGLFIPAHINKTMFSMLSQLGFIPEEAGEDALELSPHISKEEFVKKYPELKNKTFIQSSDAHYLPDIGKKSTLFKMKNRSFEEVRDALYFREKRNVFI